MFIKKLEISNFRAFKEDFSMEFGRNITCISGHNGIGKSTILAILSNCAELKKKDGKHLNGSAFRGEFSDIIVGDREFDTSGTKATIFFDELPQKKASSIKDPLVYVDQLSFRATFQKDGEKDRYRLIPNYIEGIRETNSKIVWPVYYLGLSRLYPIGESKDPQPSKISIDINKELVDVHSRLLSFDYGDNASLENIGVPEVGKSKSGIRTKNFSSTANSSGQDNLGQIILSVLSFQELKKNNSENYFGGLLIIDELDATLHAAVQMKLFDYLLEKSKELNLQIVFTTHSKTLLEYITKKYNSTKTIKISYLLKRGDTIIEKQNPTIDFFTKDLSDTYGKLPEKKVVKIFTEDETARWFIKNLFEISNNGFNIDFLETSISWSHLMILLTSDFSVFKDYIFILDPDINKTSNKDKINEYLKSFPINLEDPTSNVLIIPSPDKNNNNIEQMLWEYVHSLPANHSFFFDQQIESTNWQKHIVEENSPLSEKYKKLNNQMKYKKWFEDNKFYLEIALSYWYADNESEVTSFINKFKSAYGKIQSTL